MARVEIPCTDPRHVQALKLLERQGFDITQRKERYAIACKGSDCRMIAPDGTASRPKSAKSLVRQDGR